MFSALVLASVLQTPQTGPVDLKQAREEAAKFEAAKDFGRAAEAWERVAAANPTDWTSFVSAANDHYQAKAYRAAITDFEKADALGGPLKFDMPYSIASCYGLLGDKEKAFEYLQKAMSLGLRDVVQARTDPDLALLHGDKRFDDLLGIADFTKVNRTDGLRYDLRFLARELARMHYSPYKRHPRKEIDAFVRQLDKEIPKLDDVQVYTRFKELGALLGDGHTHVTTPFEPAAAKKAIPLTFMRFEEGIYAISSDAEHAGLLGKQLVSIDGVPVEEVSKRAERIVSWDNPMNFKARTPDMMKFPALLYGLGVAKKSTEVKMAFADGTEAVLQGNTASDPTWKTARDLSSNPTPLTFQHRDRPYWFTYLPADKTIYMEYNAVRNDPAESLEKFCGRLFEFVNSHEVDKFVLDMRWNGGGNNFLNQPLLLGLIASKVNQWGKLFVIDGRFTFSAAVCGITQIERFTNVTFVGEPSGSCPNFIGESIPIALPYSKLTGTVSDLYWENSHALDTRIWIAPDIYVPPTFADYRLNRDAALDAILGHPTPVDSGAAVLPGA